MRIDDAKTVTVVMKMNVEGKREKGIPKNR